VKYIIPLSPEFVKGYFEKTPEKRFQADSACLSETLLKLQKCRFK